jgi:hypothetical protein
MLLGSLSGACSHHSGLPRTARRALLCSRGVGGGRPYRPVLTAVAVDFSCAFPSPPRCPPPPRGARWQVTAVVGGRRVRAGPSTAAGRSGAARTRHATAVRFACALVFLCVFRSRQPHLTPKVTLLSCPSPSTLPLSALAGEEGPRLVHR